MSHVLSTEARQELTEAVRFYRRQASAAVAASFISEFERVAQVLTRFPDIGTPISSKWRMFPLRRFPYSLIYSEAEAGIRIVAVAHQRRRPGYWMERP